MLSFRQGENPGKLAVTAAEMICPTCGTGVAPGAKLCEQCGTQLLARCSRCRAWVAPAAKFCSQCGQPVRRLEATSASTAAPRSYTPEHLAEKILTSRSALEGERKQVTVLFADLKGSMELSEELDPEEWHGILDRFFQILTQGVHRFEGTVNQYTGDGIMALFGAPIAHEDHAQRACYAALSLSEELRRYADELRRERGLNFSVRMGLNSGEVVVGRIGDDLRMDYTAQGHTVGLAARMEQLAAADRVYLTEATADLVRDYFRLRDLGAFSVKGVRAPVGVFELEGVGTHRTRFDVARARGLSRFVGRASEMRVLEEALAQTVCGHGQIIAVVAEAGVGKSRLCYEFAERCRARSHIEVNEARAVPYGKSIPFLPILELLRRFCGLSERDTPEEARKKVAGTLLLRDQQFAADLPLLFDFLGITDPAGPAPSFDPDSRQRQIFEFARKLIQTRRVGGPAVLICEDLHWIDDASEAALESLVEVVPDTRTLLLVNFRPEYQPPWMARPNCQQLLLSPLEGDEIEALLSELLGTDASLAGLRDRICERTAGNPFFIEEVVRSLAETGFLEGTRGAYRTRQATADIGIPATVQSVLAARIDRLPEDTKNLLQAAAVIGKEFDEKTLGEALEQLSDVAFDQTASLRALVAAEFIYEQSLYPVVEYAFAHPLTQEVAYLSQLSERRRRTHAAVAAAMARQCGEALDERAALVAHHWQAAAESLKAAHWHRRAADWAAGTRSLEALSHLRQALALLETLPATTESLALTLRTGEALLRLGPFVGLGKEEASAVFEQSKRAADRVGDQAGLAQLVSTYGYFRTMAGALTEGESYTQAAADIAQNVADPSLQARLELDEAQAYLWQGRLPQALSLVEAILRRGQVKQLDERSGALRLGLSGEAFVWSMRGQLLAFMGHLREGVADLNRSLNLAREGGTIEGVCLANVFLAVVDYIVGDAAAAWNHAQGALEAAQQLKTPFMDALARLALGNAHLLRKEWAAACASYEALLVTARDAATTTLIDSLRLPLLAEAYLGLGDIPQARRIAEQAIDPARQGAASHTECLAWLTYTHVLLVSEGAAARAEVEADLERADALIQENRLKSLEPFVHERRAELAGVLGNEDEQRHQLHQARRLFAEVGATGHASRLASLPGEENDATP